MHITIRNDGAVREQLRAIGRQAPFALALALNGTANAVQRAVRESLSDRFTLRRKTFIENTIYRNRGTDFATKARPVAVVRVHPDRDLLAKFEDGGTKGPFSGRSVAVPLPAVRRNKNDIVTTANRPAGLKNKKNVFRAGDVLLKATGRGTRRKLTALYLFRRTVRIPKRLSMEQTAERVVPDVWEREATAAITKALATAR